jgi:hypothetical protein
MWLMVHRPHVVAGVIGRIFVMVWQRWTKFRHFTLSQSESEAPERNFFVCVVSSGGVGNLSKEQTAKEVRMVDHRIPCVWHEQLNYTDICFTELTAL